MNSKIQMIDCGGVADNIYKKYDPGLNDGRTGVIHICPREIFYNVSIKIRRSI